MRAISISLLFTITLLFSSCSNEISIKKEIFDTVDIGMTIQEVKSILGEPFEIRYSTDSLALYTYKVYHGRGDIRNAQITFDKKGYVSFFSAGLAS